MAASNFQQSIQFDEDNNPMNVAHHKNGHKPTQSIKKENDIESSTIKTISQSHEHFLSDMFNGKKSGIKTLIYPTGMGKTTESAKAAIKLCRAGSLPMFNAPRKGIIKDFEDTVLNVSGEEADIDKVKNSCEAIRIVANTELQSEKFWESNKDFLNHIARHMPKEMEFLIKKNGFHGHDSFDWGDDSEKNLEFSIKKLIDYKEHHLAQKPMAQYRKLDKTRRAGVMDSESSSANDKEVLVNGKAGDAESSDFSKEASLQEEQEGKTCVESAQANIIKEVILLLSAISEIFKIFPDWHSSFNNSESFFYQGSQKKEYLFRQLPTSILRIFEYGTFFYNFQRSMAHYRDNIKFFSDSGVRHKSHIFDSFVPALYSRPGEPFIMQAREAASYAGVDLSHPAIMRAMNDRREYLVYGFESFSYKKEVLNQICGINFLIDHLMSHGLNVRYFLTATSHKIFFPVSGVAGFKPLVMNYPNEESIYHYRKSEKPSREKKKKSTGLSQYVAYEYKAINNHEHINDICGVLRKNMDMSYHSSPSGFAQWVRNGDVPYFDLAFNDLENKHNGEVALSWGILFNCILFYANNLRRKKEDDFLCSYLVRFDDESDENFSIINEKIMTELILEEQLYYGNALLTYVSLGKLLGFNVDFFQGYREHHKIDHEKERFHGIDADRFKGIPKFQERCPSGMSNDKAKSLDYMSFVFAIAKTGSVLQWVEFIKKMMVFFETTKKRHGYKPSNTSKSWVFFRDQVNCCLKILFCESGHQRGLTEDEEIIAGYIDSFGTGGETDEEKSTKEIMELLSEVFHEGKKGSQKYEAILKTLKAMRNPAEILCYVTGFMQGMKPGPLKLLVTFLKNSYECFRKVGIYLDNLEEPFHLDSIGRLFAFKYIWDIDYESGVVTPSLNSHFDADMAEQDAGKFVGKKGEVKKIRITKANTDHDHILFYNFIQIISIFYGKNQSISNFKIKDHDYSNLLDGYSCIFGTTESFPFHSISELATARTVKPFALDAMFNNNYSWNDTPVNGEDAAQSVIMNLDIAFECYVKCIMATVQGAKFGSNKEPDDRNQKESNAVLIAQHESDAKNHEILRGFRNKIEKNGYKGTINIIGEEYAYIFTWDYIYKARKNVLVLKTSKMENNQINCSEMDASYLSAGIHAINSSPEAYVLSYFGLPSIRWSEGHEYYPEMVCQDGEGPCINYQPYVILFMMSATLNINSLHANYNMEYIVQEMGKRGMLVASSLEYPHDVRIVDEFKDMPLENSSLNIEVTPHNLYGMYRNENEKAKSSGHRNPAIAINKSEVPCIELINKRPSGMVGESVGLIAYDGSYEGPVGSSSNGISGKKNVGKKEKKHSAYVYRNDSSETGKACQEFIDKVRNPSPGCSYFYPTGFDGGNENRESFFADFFKKVINQYMENLRQDGKANNSGERMVRNRVIEKLATHRYKNYELQQAIYAIDELMRYHDMRSMLFMSQTTENIKGIMNFIMTQNVNSVEIYEKDRPPYRENLFRYYEYNQIAIPWIIVISHKALNQLKGRWLTSGDTGKNHPVLHHDILVPFYDTKFDNDTLNLLKNHNARVYRRIAIEGEETDDGMPVKKPQPFKENAGKEDVENNPVLEALDNLPENVFLDIFDESKHKICIIAAYSSIAKGFNLTTHKGIPLGGKVRQKKDFDGLYLAMDPYFSDIKNKPLIQYLTVVKWFISSGPDSGSSTDMDESFKQFFAQNNHSIVQKEYSRELGQKTVQANGRTERTRRSQEGHVKQKLYINMELYNILKESQDMQDFPVVNSKCGAKVNGLDAFRRNLSINNELLFRTIDVQKMPLFSKEESEVAMMEICAQETKGMLLDDLVKVLLEARKLNQYIPSTIRFSTDISKIKESGRNDANTDNGKEKDIGIGIGIGDNTGTEISQANGGDWKSLGIHQINNLENNALYRAALGLFISIWNDMRDISFVDSNNNGARQDKEKDKTRDDEQDKNKGKGKNQDDDKGEKINGLSNTGSIERYISHLDKDVMDNFYRLYLVLKRLVKINLNIHKELAVLVNKESSLVRIFFESNYRPKKGTLKMGPDSGGVEAGVDFERVPYHERISGQYSAMHVPALLSEILFVRLPCSSFNGSVQNPVILGVKSKDNRYTDVIVGQEQTSAYRKLFEDGYQHMDRDFVDYYSFRGMMNYSFATTIFNIQLDSLPKNLLKNTGMEDAASLCRKEYINLFSSKNGTYVPRSDFGRFFMRAAFAENLLKALINLTFEEEIKAHPEIPFVSEFMYGRKKSEGKDGGLLRIDFSYEIYDLYVFCGYANDDFRTPRYIGIDMKNWGVSSQKVNSKGIVDRMNKKNSAQTAYQSRNSDLSYRLAHKLIINLHGDRAKREHNGFVTYNLLIRNEASEAGALRLNPGIEKYIADAYNYVG